jgi:hypothetical protein
MEILFEHNLLKKEIKSPEESPDNLSVNSSRFLLAQMCANL